MICSWFVCFDGSEHIHVDVVGAGILCTSELTLGVFPIWRVEVPNF